MKTFFRRILPPLFCVLIPFFLMGQIRNTQLERAPDSVGYFLYTDSMGIRQFKTADEIGIGGGSDLSGVRDSLITLFDSTYWEKSTNPDPSIFVDQNVGVFDNYPVAPLSVQKRPGGSNIVAYLGQAPNYGLLARESSVGTPYSVGIYGRLKLLSGAHAPGVIENSAGDVGTPGQVLTSQGNGATFTYETPDYFSGADSLNVYQSFADTAANLRDYVDSKTLISECSKIDLAAAEKIPLQSGISYLKKSDNEIEVYFLGSDQIGTYYNFGVRPNSTDDLFKLNEARIDSVEVLGVINDSLNYDNATNISGTGTNRYINTPGGIIELTFTGVGIDFNAYTTTSGGIISFEIVGSSLPAVDVDTYNPTSVRKVFSLFDNLEHGTYTVRGTLTGTPNPSSSANRGWMKYDVGGNLADATFFVKGFSDFFPVWSIDTWTDYSNSEFAFSLKPQGATNLQWFPDHNNTPTAFFSGDGFRNIYVNDTLKTDIDDFFKEVKTFELDQKVYFQHPESPAVDLIELNQKITLQSGNSIMTEGHFVFLDTLETGACYVAMLPMDGNEITNFIDADFKNYDLSIVGNINIGEAAFVLGSRDSVKMGVRLFDYCGASRFDAVDRRDPAAFVSSDGINKDKYYITPFNNTFINGGQFDYKMVHFVHYDYFKNVDRSYNIKGDVRVSDRTGGTPGKSAFWDPNGQIVENEASEFWGVDSDFSISTSVSEVDFTTRTSPSPSDFFTANTSTDSITINYTALYRVHIAFQCANPVSDSSIEIRTNVNGTENTTYRRRFFAETVHDVTSDYIINIVLNSGDVVDFTKKINSGDCDFVGRNMTITKL